MTVYLVRKEGVLTALRSIRPRDVVGMVAASVVASIANGARFHATVRMYGLRLGLFESYGLSVSNALLNYALPAQGGTLMKGAYMKTRHRFGYTDYVALTASSQLVTLGVAAGMGLALLMFGVEPAGRSGAAMVGTLAVLTLLALGLLLLIGRSVVPGFIGPKWAGRMERFAAGFRYWARSPLDGMWFVLWTVIWTVVQGVRLWMAFGAVGAEVPVLATQFLQAIVVASGVVAIVPGNLGLREGVTSLSAGLLGMDRGQALLAALVDRSVSIASLLVVAPISSRLFMSARQSQERVADDGS